MSIQVIQTDKAPAAIGPYSQGIKAGPWLFVSGQIPLDPQTGQLAAGDFTAHTRQALENLGQIVKAAGYEFSDIATVDVFLTDMGQFAIFNGIYEEYFPTHKPARAVVEVKGLPRGVSVEIKCIAYKAP
jgi:2-iminobutanoate/2-iminopropanoate deaminase